MVGSAAAALAQARELDFALLDPAPAPTLDPSDYDLRVSALNPRSLALLEQLQLWESIVQTRACPFKHLRVFGANGPGLQFDAADHGVENLGYIVENSLLSWKLQSGLSATMRYRQAVKNINSADGQLELEDGTRLSADIILLTAGNNPRLLRQAGFAQSSRDYRSRALVLRVSTAYPQQDSTWQRFDSEGAQAFLPLVGKQASLVWYLSPEAAQDLLQLKRPALLAQLNNSFPPELGEIKAIKASASFAIGWHHAQGYAQNSCVLAGDSAHSVSPITGLGMNLGLADVECLFQQFDRYGLDSSQALPRYDAIQRRANSQFVNAIDLIQKSFACWQYPWGNGLARGLQLLDWCTPLKQILWQQASYLKGV